MDEDSAVEDSASEELQEGAAKPKRYGQVSIFSLLALAVIPSCFLAGLVSRDQHAKEWERLRHSESRLEEDIFFEWVEQYQEGVTPHRRDFPGDLAKKFNIPLWFERFGRSDDRSFRSVRDVIVDSEVEERKAKVADLIAKSPNIQALTWHGPLPNGAAQGIGECRNLSYLRLVDCDAASCEDLFRSVEDSKYLSILICYRCDLTPKCLESIRKLNRAKMVLLVDVTVNSTALVESDLNGLRESLDDCYILQVGRGEGE